MGGRVDCGNVTIGFVLFVDSSCFPMLSTCVRVMEGELSAQGTGLTRVEGQE